MYIVTFAFFEQLLGTAPLSSQLYSQFIATKAPNGALPAELEMIDEPAGVKGITGFRRDPAGRPCLLDYQIKGFMKEAWQQRRLNPDNLSAQLKAGKSKIDGQLFVFPRIIPILNWQKNKEELFERPLRAETAQGPRVALTASETLPPGMKIQFDLEVLTPKLFPQELLEEWFSYGRFVGMGGWRSGGFGRFTYTIRESNGNGTA